MKLKLYAPIFIFFLFWQCKKQEVSVINPDETKSIDVFEFSVPGIDQKNITVGENYIVVNLPENYSKGDYIKPEIIFQTGYSSRSPLLNGVSFEDQEIRLELENVNGERKIFDVIVVPHKAIQLNNPAKNYELKSGPYVAVVAAFDLKGTLSTVTDSGKIVRRPFLRLTDKATGQIAQELHADESYATSGNEMTVTLPPSILPGKYTAEMVWGTKTAFFSSDFNVSPGPVQLKRGSWLIREDGRYFGITAYNLSPTDKYEALIYNEFISAQRIKLQYEGPGRLSGNFPETIGVGNYKITFLVNGKEQKGYEERTGILKYMGDDQFYVQKNEKQPILRIISQPSRESYFNTVYGGRLSYYPGINVINRKEPIIGYVQYWGPGVNQEMVLVNLKTGAEYALPYSGDLYSMFDGFMTLPAYKVPDKVPNGSYAIYVIHATEKTEHYSQIITLK